MLKIMENQKNLFLDDRRMPSDAFIEKLWENDHSVYLNEEWDVVESHFDFFKWIIDNGLPKMVSFDHDLAPSHYTPKKYWSNYQMSKEWQDKQIHSEPTGLFSAIFLVDFCKSNKLNLPKCFCHSANPVGRDKILKVLEDFYI